MVSCMLQPSLTFYNASPVVRALLCHISAESCPVMHAAMVTRHTLPLDAEVPRIGGMRSSLGISRTIAPDPARHAPIMRAG
jgi:hypothetical protein